MGPNSYAVQCIFNGEEYPQNRTFLWDFVTLPEEERATAIGNIYKKIGKNRSCGSGDILSDRQTHSQTDTHRRAHHNT